MSYYFELEQGSDIKDYKFFLDNEKVDVSPISEGSKYYYFNAPPKHAYLNDIAENVIVKKGDTVVFNFNYSVIKWAEIASGKATDTDEINMIKSLYNYYEAAKEFVASNQ